MKTLSNSVSHKGARVQKSYYVRVARAGGPLNEQTELIGCWAFGDELPSTWAAICADRSVTDAQLFRSLERCKPHQRRKIVASYIKQTSVVVA